MIQASALSPHSGLHWFQSSQITLVIRSTMSLQETDFIKLWHYHFGLASTNVLWNAYKTCTGFPLDRLSTFTEVNWFYKGYALEKHTQTPHTPSDSHTTSVISLTHTDLLELLLLSRNHNKWVITFLDNYSSYACIAFLKKKSDVFAVFAAF